MSASIDQLVQLGFDLIGTKYYVVGVGTLYFFDYFLTLGDEVEYAWQGTRTWLFYLFILNRYVPMVYAGWMYAAISLIYPKSVCDKTAVFEFLFFFWATFIAQVFLVIRIHALTWRNRFVTGFFILLTTAQLVVGVMFMASPDKASINLPDIKLDPFYLCVFPPNWTLEPIYTSISLAFDAFAFGTIIISAYMSLSPAARNLGTKGVIGTVMQDATIYFGMIFTSHLIFTVFIFRARPILKLTPAAGTTIFLPMMVSRLVLSLRKSADPRFVNAWSVDHFTRVETADASRVQFAMQPVVAGTYRSELP